MRKHSHEHDDYYQAPKELQDTVKQVLQSIKCPVCGSAAKKVKTPKYPTEKWYYCANPSCNKTVFQVS